MYASSAGVLLPVTGCAVFQIASARLRQPGQIDLKDLTLYDNGVRQVRRVGLTNSRRSTNFSTLYYGVDWLPRQLPISKAKSSRRQGEKAAVSVKRHRYCRM